MQETLSLFDTEKIEREFEFTFDSKTKEQFGHKLVSRSVHVRRGQRGKVDCGFQIPNDKDYTFIHISGLNFVGQRGNTEFRFITDSSGLPCDSDVIIPELNNLSRERLIDFIENVIQRIIDGEFEWDSIKRKRVYNTKGSNSPL